MIAVMANLAAPKAAPNTLHAETSITARFIGCAIINHLHTIAHSGSSTSNGYSSIADDQKSECAHGSHTKIVQTKTQHTRRGMNMCLIQLYYTSIEL